MPYKRKDREGWWFRCRDTATGKRVQRYGGQTKAEAREVEDLFRLNRQSGASSSRLAKFLLDTFLPEQRANLTPESFKRELGIINKYILPAFDGPLSSITPEQITQYKNTRLAQASPDTVLKELQVLKHILRLAVDFDLIVKSPFNTVKMPKAAPGRVRYIQPEEWARIYQALPDHYQAAALFLVNTGCRRSEALGLLWQNVDLDNAVAVIPKDKRNKGKVVPLNEAVVSVLRDMHRREGDDHVFFTVPNGRAMTTAFERAARKAGVVNFRLHDLRHTFASWVMEECKDLALVGKLLGHSDLRSTQRYAHLFDERMKQASESLKGRFSGSAGVATLPSRAVIARNGEADTASEPSANSKSSSPDGISKGRFGK